MQSKRDVFKSKYRALKKLEPLLLQTWRQQVRCSLSLLSTLVTRKEQRNKLGTACHQSVHFKCTQATCYDTGQPHI